MGFHHMIKSCMFCNSPAVELTSVPANDAGGSLDSSRDKQASQMSAQTLFKDKSLLTSNGATVAITAQDVCLPATSPAASSRSPGTRASMPEVYQLRRLSAAVSGNERGAALQLQRLCDLLRAKLSVSFVCVDVFGRHRPCSCSLAASGCAEEALPLAVPRPHTREEAGEVRVMLSQKATTCYSHSNAGTTVSTSSGGGGGGSRRIGAAIRALAATASSPPPSPCATSSMGQLASPLPQPERGSNPRYSHHRQQHQKQPWGDHWSSPAMVGSRALGGAITGAFSDRGPSAFGCTSNVGGGAGGGVGDRPSGGGSTTARSSAAAWQQLPPPPPYGTSLEALPCHIRRLAESHGTEMRSFWALPLLAPAATPSAPVAAEAFPPPSPTLFGAAALRMSQPVSPLLGSRASSPRTAGASPAMTPVAEMAGGPFGVTTPVDQSELSPFAALDCGGGGFGDAAGGGGGGGLEVVGMLYLAGSDESLFQVQWDVLDQFRRWLADAVTEGQLQLLSDLVDGLVHAASPEAALEEVAARLSEFFTHRTQGMSEVLAYPAFLLPSTSTSPDPPTLALSPTVPAVHRAPAFDRISETVSRTPSSATTIQQQQVVVVLLPRAANRTLLATHKPEDRATAAVPGNAAAAASAGGGASLPLTHQLQPAAAAEALGGGAAASDALRAVERLINRTGDDGLLSSMPASGPPPGSMEVDGDGGDTAAAAAAAAAVPGVAGGCLWPLSSVSLPDGCMTTATLGSYCTAAATAAAAAEMRPLLPSFMTLQSFAMRAETTLLAAAAAAGASRGQALQRRPSPPNGGGAPPPPLPPPPQCYDDLWVLPGRPQHVLVGMVRQATGSTVSTAALQQATGSALPAMRMAIYLSFSASMDRGIIRELQSTLDAVLVLLGQVTAASLTGDCPSSMRPQLEELLRSARVVVGC